MLSFTVSVEQTLWSSFVLKPLSSCMSETRQWVTSFAFEISIWASLHFLYVYSSLESKVAFLKAEDFKSENSREQIKFSLSFMTLKSHSVTSAIVVKSCQTYPRLEGKKNKTQSLYGKSPSHIFMRAYGMELLQCS